MSSHILFLSKAFAALFADERLFFAVFAFMRAQFSTGCKCHLTFSTGVWFFSTVTAALMNAQRRTVCETLATLATDAALLGAVLAFLMPAKIADLRKTQITVLACIWPLSGVYVLMPSQVLRGRCNQRACLTRNTDQRLVGFVVLLKW
jgi:hypothetical protein